MFRLIPDVTYADDVTYIGERCYICGLFLVIVS